MIITVNGEGKIMKKLYFGSNLKMYKGIQETEKYLKKLEENTKNINRKH